MSTISPDPEHCATQAARCSRATEEASVWIGKKKPPETEVVGKMSMSESSATIGNTVKQTPVQYVKCSRAGPLVVPVTNSSLELEMFKKQLKDKMIEVEQLKSDVMSKNENLQTMVKASEDQEQRFALEIDSLKDEIANLKMRKSALIEEFTKYVEEKDSAHITKEKEFSKAMSDKQKEVIEANEKLKSQTSLNEKYKKLLQSKDNELDQAQTNNLEIKEKLKEENKKNKLSSKELSDMKEVRKKLKKDNEMKDKEIELKGKQLEKLEANLKDASEKICKLDDKNKVLEKLVVKGDSNYQKLKQELSAKTDKVTSLQISVQKLTKKIKVPPVNFDDVMPVSSDSDSN